MSLAPMLVQPWRDIDAHTAVDVAIVTASGGRTVHLAQLVVAPAARGRQVGDLLLQRVCASAAALGFETITLLVDAENTPARRLYGRWGFREASAFVVGRLVPAA
ncbi:MAG: GNAT family N-acetyltransferase [Acidobacteriota bacterium]